MAARNERLLAKATVALGGLTLLLCCAGCAATAEGERRPEATTGEIGIAAARRELEATFAERARAFEAKDYDTLVRQISADYTAVRPDGSTMNRDDLAQYIRRNLDRWVRIIRLSNVIEGMRLEGNDAVLDMRQDFARIQLVDGREALVESSVLQTETWTRTADGWKLLAVRNERDQRVTVDGQPLP